MKNRLEEFFEYLPHKIFVENLNRFQNTDETKKFIEKNNIKEKILKIIPKEDLESIIKFGIGEAPIRDNVLYINQFKIKILDF